MTMVAKTGRTDRTELTFPRLVGSVTSATQVLNAASLAVEPATVIKQSNATSKNAIRPIVFPSARIGRKAKIMMVRPQTI